MGFTSGNGSSPRAKEISRGLKSISKTSSPHNQLKHDLKIQKAGLDQAHQKETSANVTEPEPKVVDVDDQNTSIDGLSEDSDFVLLSSDSLSSSLLSSDDSQDVVDFDSFRLSLQHQFSSIVSSTGSSDVSLDKGNEAFVFDGSKNSPESNISSSREMISEGKDAEDSQPWLVGKEGKGSSVAESESSNSYVIEDRSMSSISDELHSKNVDIPSWDFDRTDIWVSSLDLEEEDSELIQDREKEYDIFDSDFPSPSFSTISATKHLQMQLSSSKSSDSVGQEVVLKSTATDSEEPLFWPFDDSLYSRLDFEKFLCPSPCKVERSAITTGFPGSKLTRLRQHQNSPQTNRKETQRPGRRTTFSPQLKSATAKYETKGANNGAQKMASTPSRLSRLTRAPSPQHPCSISKRRGKPQLEIDVEKHGCSSTDSLGPPPKELESHDSVSERDSIEGMVGLNEFDGHEGTDTDFDQQVTLYLSPCGGSTPVRK